MMVHSDSQRYGSFHSHGGTPTAGWFIMENTLLKCIIWGTPIYGNLHIKILLTCRAWVWFKHAVSREPQMCSLVVDSHAILQVTFWGPSPCIIPGFWFSVLAITGEPKRSIYHQQYILIFVDSYPRIQYELPHPFRFSCLAAVLQIGQIQQIIISFPIK